METTNNTDNSKNNQNRENSNTSNDPDLDYLINLLHSDENININELIKSIDFSDCSENDLIQLVFLKKIYSDLQEIKTYLNISQKNNEKEN